MVSNVQALSRRVAAFGIAAVLLAVMCMCAALAAPGDAFAQGVQEPQASGGGEDFNGWNKARTKYYVDSVAVTGARKVEGTWRAFDAKGTLKKSTFKLEGWTYYPDSKGVLRARSKGGAYYYNNGTAMTRADTRDFKCLRRAEKVIAQITKKSDSMATKRLKAFRWVMKHGYKLHRSFSSVASYWPAAYAMDHFKRIGGDCHADAATFAYLAAAIGYKNVYACRDSRKTRTRIGGHAWCKIGNAVFDPLFASSKGFRRFYNSTRGSYEVNPVARVKIPFYSPSHAGKKSVRVEQLRPKGGWKKAK